MQIGAVIVAYNPDVNILQNTLHFLTDKKIKTVVVDNKSENFSEFGNVDPDVVYIAEHENVGIAKGLNDGIDWLGKRSYDWVLTLDQDTVLPENYFDEMFSNEHNLNENVGVYYPKVLDRNDTKEALKKGEKKRRKMVKKNPNALFLPIQSGAFLRISAFYSIGGFDESLFIDNVDHDYFLEIMSENLELRELKKTVINHALGRKTDHNFLGFKFRSSNHSAFRYYYIFRNMPIVVKRHKKILQQYHSSMLEVKRTEFQRAMKVLLGENDKIAKFSAMYRGLKDQKKISLKRAHYL